MRHPLRIAFAVVFLTRASAAQLPQDFVDELVVRPLAANGVTFDAGGRAYVWSRLGMVWALEDGERVEPALLNLVDEVGSYRDLGFLGFALDPRFLENGYLYGCYVVDRHHLLYFGTPQYDPQANINSQATIGRIVRYTADPATGFTTLIPGSRQVLVGESIDTGIPIVGVSHGTGALAFGADGSLLVAVGDAASFNAVDRGGDVPGSFWSQALADGILRAKENVGALRAQLVDCLNGKLLRIDPETGDGLPTNPFFDPAQPRAARSRVWALGLRNPYRISVRPGTGHPDPAFGDPGVLYIGDVGWNDREELDVLHEPGANLGWPVFEGLFQEPSYAAAAAEVMNLDAPNPLFPQGGCARPFFTFAELILQDRPDHEPFFPNPCDPSREIPPGTPTFVHHRPVLDWSHFSDVARVPVFSGGVAAAAVLGEPGCPVAGESFRGSCAVGGTWLGDTGFGDFSGTYLLLDYTAGWMRSLRFDAHDRLAEVRPFGTLNAPLIAVEDPNDGSVLYATTLSIRRIRYVGDANVAPDVALAASAVWGPGPLTVRFDGTGSQDPEGEPLAFHWDFGDGHASDEPSPVHAFAGAESPATSTVRLTATDPRGAAREAELAIHVDDTPPRVAITSFANGARYASTGPTELALEAAVEDAESADDELAYAWQVILRHDTHEHPDPVDPRPVTAVVLDPTPCSSSFYAYRVELTVTDPGGLATKAVQWLFPDCAVPVAVEVEPAAGRLVPGRETLLAARVDGPVERLDFFVNGERVGTAFGAPFRAPWTPARAGTYVVSALARAFTGEYVTSAGHALEVAAPFRTESAIAVEEDDASEVGGAVTLDDPVLDLGGDRLVGLRFRLDVPRGATILGATLQGTAAGAADLPASLVVRAEAADDAAPIGSAPHELGARPVTASVVAWNVAPWIYPLAAGQRQQSPELALLVQELVDRPGFRRGNAVLLLLASEGDGARAGSRPLVSRDADPLRGARLAVDWILERDAARAAPGRPDRSSGGR